MQTPVEIDYQGLQANDQLRDCVARNVSTLEERFGRITACRVVIRVPSERHRKGGAFDIRIRLSLPQGREVDIGRSEKGQDHVDNRLLDPVIAVNDAFKRARRQLQDQAQRMQGHVKFHESAPVATVSRYDEAAGYGFLETPDGREVYFHKNSVIYGSSPHVMPGTRVTFCEEMGIKGPQASSVRLLGKHGMR